MGNRGNELANIINIISGDDISDTSSHTRVVDPKMQSTAPLVSIHPLVNLIFFSETFEFRESYIVNGSKFRNHYFDRNIDNLIGRVEGVKLDLLASGEVSPNFPYASLVADPKSVEKRIRMT